MMIFATLLSASNACALLIAADASEPNAAGISKAVLVSKPIAYWPLRESQNSLTPDKAGKHEARLELGAGPLEPGSTKPNFSGGRAKADLGQLGDTYSLELWFFNEQPGASRPIAGYLASRGKVGVKGAPGDHLGIGGTFAARDRLLFFNGDDKNTVLPGSRELVLRTWHHAALVRQQNKIAVYLDGNATPEISGDARPGYTDASAEFVFGGRNDGLFPLRGRLCDVAIYDRALTTAEIAEHFRAGGVDPAAVAETLVIKPDFPPLSPQESLKVTQVRDGFVMELMAAEPMVLDPVAIEWGPDGKLWVVEMADYPTGIDLNMKPGGRIRYLEDTDDDGEYDKSTLFMTDVNFPTGVLPWRSGVVVTAAPEIFYAADTNGDGKADLRQTLYRGFVEGNTQLRVNGLQWGLDGWVYCANGWSGGVIHAEKSNATVDIRGRDFRIRLDDNQLDAQSGQSEFGRNRDDWGNWFGCDNAHPLFHFVLDDGYIRRNPHTAPADTKAQIIVPEAPKVFAVSPPEKRFHDFAAVDRFTSACAAMIYRDELLFGSAGPPHAFVCEPVHNLVHHEVLTPSGVTFTAARPPEEIESEFIASKDRWFKPVNLRTGPDGALWVVDMYRYMVEHPEWLPPEGKIATAPFLRLGDDRGRLYRVYPKGTQPRAVPKLHRLSTAKLVAALDSPNGWQRDNAQRLLVIRCDESAIVLLEKLAAESTNPLARLHALCVLSEMGAIKESGLLASLADKHPMVRRQALRCAESVTSQSVISAAVKLADDADPPVRLQLACTLGGWKGDLAAHALAQLWIKDHADSHVAAAVLSSLHGDNIAVAISSASAADGPTTQLAPLLVQAAAFNRLELLASMLGSVLSGSSLKHDRQTEMLAAVLDALERRQIGLAQLYSAAAESDQARKLISERIAHATQVVFDPNVADAERARSVALVGRDGADRAQQLERLAGLLAPQNSPELQQAVVAHLATRADPIVAKLLLANWPSHVPSVRSQVLNALLSRPEWSAALLDAIDSKTVLPAELDAQARQRLTSLADQPLRERATRLLSSAGDQDRQRVVAEHQSVLDLMGNATRGAELFKAKCSVCHRLGDIGDEVGPNLAALSDKSPRSLLAAMLDPSQAVETRYQNYLALTADGRTFSGILGSETATSVTLVGQKAERNVLLRSELETFQSTGKSLMPDGLEKELKPQDFADLLAHVAHATKK